MRFGTFVFSLSSDPTQDHQVIEQTLREVELAEAIGMDAVWLTEHHFDGAVAYADPVVFAAAVAMRTHRVRIGFAVVEMALHHPVRLAVQTALVDNLSRGRLIVGTGRGSAYNAYEYVGFGTTLAEGHERLPEAEALLIKAWTTDDVRHAGRYWQATFPRLRPCPYQQPHPPLVRACIGEDSLVEMAKIGRPVLIGVQTLETLRHRLQRYRETMLAEGFAVTAVEQALDATWAQRGSPWRTATTKRWRGPPWLSDGTGTISMRRGVCITPGAYRRARPAPHSRRRRSSNTPSWPGRRSGSQSRSPPSSKRESGTCC